MVVADEEPCQVANGLVIFDDNSDGSEEVDDRASSSNVRTTERSDKLRDRTLSASKAEDHVVRCDGKIFFTAGRPPWYNFCGDPLCEPFIIGVAGGSASGKTSVANRIIANLGIQWVTVLSMDRFYNVLTAKQHEAALNNAYDFDHPDAFDFELLHRTLIRLKQGKRAVVPSYNFNTHCRENKHSIMYGASVLVFEGILAFHKREILDVMDLKVFVDTDADIRLARRLQRDTVERGRDIQSVIQQYDKFVKPAFDNFIAPTMRHADIIIPRGGENEVAIHLIALNIKNRLEERRANSRAVLASGGYCNKATSNGGTGCEPIPMPPTLHLLTQGPQIRGMHTLIRNRDVQRNEFIFYSNRLMRLLIEHSLSLLPFEDCVVDTPQGKQYRGKRRVAEKICGISILRAGETMETALREVVKDCIISKILIQTNPRTMEPELYYLTLPKDIHLYQILLMDATVATGAAAMMAIRILLDHDVPEENITVVALLMAVSGVQSVAYAFPKVRMVTTAVDKDLSREYYILPGIGNFGDRYFGTDIYAQSNSSV